MEKKDRLIVLVSITSVVFAVLAAISNFKASGQSTQAVLAQSQASDQWAYYQSKSIKQHAYEVQLNLLQLEHERKDVQSLMTDYIGKIERYNQEKDEIKAKAESLEHVRDGARRHGGEFGVAVMFLQVAILLSAIAGLTKKFFLWGSSAAVGAIGILYFFNGFYLFF